MKKAFIMIAMIMLVIATSAFADDMSLTGHYVQTVKTYETLINVGDGMVGVDILDTDLIQEEIGFMQSVGWNVLTVTPVVTSMPTENGGFTPVTRYIIVVYERWVD